MLVLAVLVYLCALFAIAHFGDRYGAQLLKGRIRPLVYALTISVYCTSWTFLGSVGLASRSGFDFLTIYIGPILVFGLGGFLLTRIIRLAKAQNINSIADFVAARYGKSEAVAATVTLIAVIGVLPYIALQLKAVSASLDIVRTLGGVEMIDLPFLDDLSPLIALLLAVFAIAFGVRRVDTTEHHDGLMLAVAVESLVKLFAFLGVGAYVTFIMFDGPRDLFARASQTIDLMAVLGASSDPMTLAAMTLVAAFAVILLPRQFHVAVTENRSLKDVRLAAWQFPLYLILINIFVVPIAIAGLTLFPQGSIDRDMTVLALPFKGGSIAAAAMALLGGISAATAMVIVELVALSIMISNDIVMPVLIKSRGRGRGSDAANVAAATSNVRASPNDDTPDMTPDMGSLLLTVRRLSIIVVMLLAYVYFKLSNEAALASIGLLSFAAIAQIAPAMFGGLFWRRATAQGATAGLVCGTVFWAYTLLLPSLAGRNPADALNALIEAGPFGIEALKPTALFGLKLSSFAHGVFVSLAVNCIAFVAVSLLRSPTAIEKMQGLIFAGADSLTVNDHFLLWRSSVTIEELKATVSRYLGEDRTNRAFESFLKRGPIAAGSSDLGLGGSIGDALRVEADTPAGAAGEEADAQTVRFAEHLLASAIGAASSRLVLSLLLRRRNLSTKAALKLLDDASAAIQHNRDILQQALDHMMQGVAVYDSDLRLVASNHAFQKIFGYPDDIIRPGIGIDEIIGYNVRRGAYGPVDPTEYIAKRLDMHVQLAGPFRLKLMPLSKIIELRSNALPDGGVVTTYTDVTAAVEAEEDLARANETLEQRVHQRTVELTRVNDELAHAKEIADDANLSKTRFLAAAGHDILQPLNAARLYASALVERMQGTEGAALAGNVDASLDAVEEILTTLLDISRLDAGAMRPEITTFHIDDLFRQLLVEFKPAADAKSLRLTFVKSTHTITSDRLLLRRLLQNLVSNALKYTQTGRVLIGARSKGSYLRVEVHDTGLGIPKGKQRLIFQEFQRLEAGARYARGLGLGLSIVERIGRVLDHPIAVRSTPAKGSMFSVMVPLTIETPSVVPIREFRKIEAASVEGLAVLCIDNEIDILKGLDVLLSGWGCIVHVAATFDEAQDLINAGLSQPDCIIADYHLDRGTGVEVVESLRYRNGRYLPAILLTADRSQEVRNLAQRMRIDVLQKPVKPDALRALLGQHRNMRAAAE